MSRPALRDPLAEIAMCLNAANAALPDGVIDDPARIPFIRLQLNRALGALERLAAQTPTLRLVGADDLGRAAGHDAFPHATPSMAGGPPEVA